mgnify:CR=1 FL=1
MKKLTAITTSIYLTMVSVALAAEQAHGDTSHGAEEASKGGFDLEPEELMDVLEQIKRGKKITDQAKTRMAKNGKKMAKNGKK